MHVFGVGERMRPVLGQGEADGSIGAEPGQLVGLHEVARRLGVCTRSVHRLIARGELVPPVKVGRASRWFVADIEAYLTTLRTERAQRYGLAKKGDEP